MSWHYCEKCKEIVKYCEHYPKYVIRTSSNTQPLKESNKVIKESKCKEINALKKINHNLAVKVVNLEDELARLEGKE